MTDQATKDQDCIDPDRGKLERSLRRLTTLAVQLRRFTHTVRVTLNRYADADASTAPDPFANHQWYEFVGTAWAAQARVLEAGRLGKETAELLDRIAPEKASGGTWPLYPYRAELVARLGRRGLDPDFVGSLAAAMPSAFHDWPKRWGATSWTALFEITQKRGVDLGAWVRASVLVAADIPERRRVLESLLPDGGELHPLGGEIPCSALPEPWSSVCTAIAITILVIGAVAALLEYFDWTFDDDRARDFIGRRTCAELRALPDADLISLIRRLQDGLTLDDDERAILRILDCLPCERVRTVVAGVGRASLLFDLDGSEWDRLMLRLRECGIVRFSDWDDDAARRFIRESECSVLNRLTQDDIRQLLLNLFEGDTHDEDERAILRLIACLPCGRVRDLMQRRGLSYDDFDDEVDGSEWDELQPILLFARDRCLG